VGLRAAFAAVLLIVIAAAAATGTPGDLLNPVGTSFGLRAEAAEPFPALQGGAAVGELKRRGLYESLVGAMRGTRGKSKAVMAPDAVAQQAYLKASNTQANDFFGYSVAVSGDTAVVGAFGEASSATGVNGDQSNNSLVEAGAAYVFVRSGGVWSQQAYLKASNPDAGDSFGFAVAVSGDTIVVGASSESSNATGVNGDQSNNSAFSSGAAYVFARTGGVWSQQAYLKASNTDSLDGFGYSVAVSGETVVVGAFGEGSNATGVNGNQANNSASASGAVYVFTRTGGTWSQQAYLKASNTGTGDVFGTNVALSGDTLAVAAYGEASSSTGVNGNQGDNSAPSAGAAYIFTRTGGTWSQQAYLKASNAESSDFFGTSVAVSGNTVVVGASGERSNATGVNGDQSNNSAEGAGAAYVFVRSGAVWTQQAYLKASNTQANDFFGLYVALSGDTIVVSASGEDSTATGVNGDQSNNSGTDSGAAYVFTRSGASWSQQAYLKASNSEPLDRFGTSVSVSGDTVIVGARREDSSATGVNGDQANNAATDAGAAYVFTGAGPPLPPSVSGVVTYGTTPAGQATKFVPGVILAAVGTDMDTDTTDLSGAYFLSAFGPGPLTVTPSKSGSINGSISGLDAARVAQHVAGLITLTANQQIAGDATGNGSLSGLDAARIAQYAAGLTNPGIAGQWKFLPPSRSYPNVTGPITGENYEAILVGEVTGNWSPPFQPRPGDIAEGQETGIESKIVTAPAAPDHIDASGKHGFDRVAVELAEPGATTVGNAIEVPLRISDTTARGIVAYQFDIRFDPALLTPAEFPTNAAGTMSDGWSIVYGIQEPGRIRVVAFGTTALAGTGTLLNLRFDTTGGSARRQREVRLTALELNEGEVPSLLVNK
jgi:hypothetical protein